VDPPPESVIDNVKLNVVAAAGVKLNDTAPALNVVPGGIVPVAMVGVL